MDGSTACKPRATSQVIESPARSVLARTTTRPDAQSHTVSYGGHDPPLLGVYGSQRLSFNDDHSMPKFRLTAWRDRSALYVLSGPYYALMLACLLAGLSKTQAAANTQDVRVH